MELSELEAGFSGLQLQEIMPEQCIENMKVNLKRDLPEVRMCKPHPHKMSIAGGGPSLAETKDDLNGYIMAVNGSLRYLLDEGIMPNACNLLDPAENLDEIIEAVPGIHYYVASIVNPKVFEKLKNCHVIRWTPSGTLGADEVVKDHTDDWFMIGGGSTVSLRAINLGYVCGFREFHLHGLDSSCREDEAHAYPQNEPPRTTLRVNGRKTFPNYIEQIKDFSLLLKRFAQPDVEETKFTVHGEGLLQDWYKYKLNRRN